MTIEQLEIERIERMIRVLSKPRPIKYSHRSREQDQIIIQNLTVKLENMAETEKV